MNHFSQQHEDQNFEQQHQHHHHHAHNPNVPPKWHSFKLLVDPAIHRGAPKLVRYDGVIPGDPHHLPPNPSDPRTRLPNSLWKRLEPMELPVPKFKVDDNYIGDPPKVEVTIENLNDNVDTTFLHNMIAKFGIYEEMIIYYHPLTRKHLGLARIVFEEVKSAKECVKHLHGRSVMGQMLNCYLDPRGASCRKMFSEMTEEQPKPEPVIPDAPPLPIPTFEEEEPEENSSHQSREREREVSTWDRDEPRHISRRRDSASGGRRSEHSSSRERWSDSRDRNRDRHRDRDRYRDSDRGSYRDNDRDSHRDSDRDRGSTRHSYNNDDFHQSQHALQLQQQAQFDPSYSQPDYWLKAAQQYARQQGTDVGNESPPGLRNDVKIDTEDQEVEVENDESTTADSQVVDLDTRLKMLMKDKTGAMPAFLLQQLSGSDNDSDKEGDASTSKRITKELDDDDVTPLSRPPSPFLSADHYYRNLRNRTKKKSAKTSKAPRPESQNSDRMSLSSLSSAENNPILQQPVQNPASSYYGYFAQPPLPGHPPPPPGFPPPNGWNGIYPTQYPPPGSFVPPGFPGFMPHPHYPDWSSGGWNRPDNDPYSGFYSKPKRNDKNVYRSVINEAVQQFVGDLKKALVKDIQKKMIESVAFYHFENWWADQEQKYKDKIARTNEKKSSTSSSVPPVGVPPSSLLIALSSNKENTSSNVVAPDTSLIKTLPRIPKAEDLSTLFDQQRQNIEANRGLAGSTFGAGGCLGFGFRGTIPKLPSFKRKPAQSAVTSRRGQVSTDDDERKRSKNKTSKDRKISEILSDEDRKSSKRNERRRDHEQRREERREKDRKSESQTVEQISSKVSTPVRKTTSQSSSDDELELSEDDKRSKVRQKRKVVKKSSSSEKGLSSSSDESSTSVRSYKKSSSSAASSASSSSEDGKVDSEVESVRKGRKGEKKVSEDDDESSRQASTKSSSSSESKSASAESSSSSSTSSSASSSSESEKSVSEQEEIEETRKRKRPMPVRRASVAVSVVDIPNGEIQDIVDIEKDEEPRIQSPAYMTDHCYAKPVVEEKSKQFENQFANDHGYSRPRTPPSSAAEPEVTQPKLPSAALPKTEIYKPKKSTEIVKPKPSLKPQKVVTFSERGSREEFEILYRFLTNGLDLEDLRYFQISYQMMLKREEMSKLLNYTHWVDHPVAEPPPVKRRRSDEFAKPHLTGSCRTEGYYKMDPREKRRTKYHLQRPEAFEALSQQYRFANTEGSVTKAKGQTSQSQSREARSVSRRQLAVLGDEAFSSDLLKFNQLKFRRKQLSFGKSAIHDWGLFAREDIGADEMVIEYVGHVIRPLIADVREKRYEKQGIGSSYLFRIDQDYVVDATKCGNLARFINHSCDPNCYAKIITIDGEKKIVIYSKQPIAFGEEITYDYKFPIEDEKIHCLCGAKNCRKYLN